VEGFCQVVAEGVGMMDKLKRFAIRALLILLPILTTSCHYAVTSPRLWAHSSSAAFDAWMFLWVVNIGAIVWAVIIVFQDAERKEK
jgi:hypothetical protein